jgi:hypothetical protein
MMLDDVNGKDGTVESTRPVASSSGRRGNRNNRYARRPTPWPLPNPDPSSMIRTSPRRKAANATQSSEEGDAVGPLPGPRLAGRRALRNAERVRRARVAAPKPAPREYLPGPSSRLDVHPDAEMMDSLAARVGPDATRSLGDADIAGSADVDPPPTPPRSPLRLSRSSGDADISLPPTPPPRSPSRLSLVRTDTNGSGRTVRDEIMASALERRLQSSTITFAPGTKTQSGSSGKRWKGKGKARFDSVDPQAGHYVPGGRKSSSDGSDTAGPAPPASDSGENVSDGSRESGRSNRGQRILDVVDQLTRKTTKRPSVASKKFTSQSQARPRDGSRTTTGTDEVNPGTAIHDVLNMYRGDPARKSSRSAVTAIPKVPKDLGILPDTSDEDAGWPGLPKKRTKRVRAIEEEPEEDPGEEPEEEELIDDDDERSPTDTRAPQLPLPESLSPLSLKTFR